MKTPDLSDTGPYATLEDKSTAGELHITVAELRQDRARQDFKTPERVRRNSVKSYRRKNGIPEELPRYARAEPFNRKRRGSDNRERRISMPREAWARLDRMKGKRTRGETVATALELMEMTE